MISENPARGELTNEDSVNNARGELTSKDSVNWVRVIVRVKG